MINDLRAGLPTYLSAVDGVSSDISVLKLYRIDVLPWAQHMQNAVISTAVISNS